MAQQRPLLPRSCRETVPRQQRLSLPFRPDPRDLRKMYLLHCHCGQNAFPRGKGFRHTWIPVMGRYMAQCPDCKCTVYGRDDAELEKNWYAEQEKRGHVIEEGRKAQNQRVG
jgi:hypothetical protein